MTPEPSTPEPQWRTLWTGGAYEEQEGVEVTSHPDGVWIRPWYEGVYLTNSITLLSWELIDEMRAEQ